MDFTEILKRIRDEEVTGLDQYARGKSDAPTLYRPVVFEATKARDDDDAPIDIFVASTEDEDRGGDVIKQSGWDLKNFKRNPVYMWAHNYAIAPIGSVPKVWREGKSLLNTVKFDLDDDFAANIARKFSAKILRAQSVGFRPVDFEERERDTGTKGAFGSFLFKKSELLEISGVPIPMNQAALRKAVDAGARPVFFMDGIELPGIQFPGSDDSTSVVASDYTIKWDEAVAEEKAGRSLSKKNLDSLTKAADSIEIAAEAIKAVVDTARSTDDEPEPQDKSETVEPEVPESTTETELLNAKKRGVIRQALRQVMEES